VALEALDRLAGLEDDLSVARTYRAAAALLRRDIAEAGPAPARIPEPHLRLAVAALQRELGKVTADRDAWRQAAETAAAQLDRARDRVARLRKKLKRARAEAQAAREEVEHQRETAQAARDARDRLVALHAEAVRHVAEARDQRAAALEHVKTLTARLAETAPETALRSTESAEQASGGDVDAPEAPGGSQAVLRVVEAARTWREHFRDRRGPFLPQTRALFEAVDALGTDKINDMPVFDLFHAGGFQDGWEAGVRWAAAEADAQGARWIDGRATVGDLLDITDHLRACAGDPERGTLVERHEAPETRS
jgi:hypothetical protein